MSYKTPIIVLNDYPELEKHLEPIRQRGISLEEKQRFLDKEKEDNAEQGLRMMAEFLGEKWPKDFTFPLDGTRTVSKENGVLYMIDVTKMTSFDKMKEMMK